MKSLIFKELLLQSPWDRRARRLVFHPETTIVRGRNGTGKSALITSLYRCFGAEPAQTDREWTQAQIYSVLKFELRGRPYRLFHADPYHALFDGSNTLMQVFRDSSEFGKFLSNWLDFQATFPDAGGPRTLTPASLLAPFYMDQDASWQRPWSGFRDLGYFANAHADLAEFLIGTKAASYFAHRDQLVDANRRKEEQKSIEAGLSSVAKGLSEEHYAPLSFNLDEDAYKAEIQGLVAACESIRARQESFREQFVGLSIKKKDAEIQIAIAETAAKEAERDHEHAMRHAEEGEIKCPTCNKVYPNSFIGRFSLKDDEDDCRAVAMKLRGELKRLNDSLDKLTARYKRDEEDLAKVNTHLQRKLGEVGLRDLINRRGHEVLQAIVETKSRHVHQLIAGIEGEIDACRQFMDVSERSSQRKGAFQRYSELMKEFLAVLGVSGEFAQQESFGGLGLNLTKSIRARGAHGSALPRTLLAYQFAILQLMSQRSSAVLCPLVIDSPRQQDPDAESFRRILGFIRERRPKGQQLILAFVDGVGVEFPGSVIELVERRGLLRENEYHNVARETRGLLDQMPVDRLLWS